MTRQFTAKPAVREAVPLLVGLMGPSSSGKTFSALRLATGIQSVTGGPIYVIDTESRRALHYADQFKFEHIQFDAPFGSLDYLEALLYCAQQGAKVIVCDSMSHEHSGPGGYLLTQEAELDRMAGSDFEKRERSKFAAWIKPAKLRQRLITGILQLNANMIFCFRAKEKTKPQKIDGKTKPIELGFMPIAGEEFLFEMTVSCLLLPRSGGVPSWTSDHVGERQMMKLTEPFKSIFAEHKPLDENIGRALAEWARGGAPAQPRQESSAASQGNSGPPGEAAGESESDEIAHWDGQLADSARTGLAGLQSAWCRVPVKIKPMLKAALDRRHKPAAEHADAEKVAAE